MADAKTEKTVADELRQAAKVLRCDHAFPCYPPTGTFRQPGPCRHCGLPRLVVADEVPEALAEPLASWLEEEADWLESVPEHKRQTMIASGQLDNALAVARVLNGTAS